MTKSSLEGLSKSEIDELFRDEDEPEVGVKLGSPISAEIKIKEINDIVSNKDNIEKLKYFYQGVDRILAKSIKLKVLTLTGGEYPPMVEVPKGFCDVSNHVIALNVPSLASDANNLTEFIMALKAINYHELAHWLYGVRNLGVEVREIASELQMLNDCRDETIFSVEFPRAREYFRFAVLKYIAHGNIDNFILLWGRRTYIPLDIIKKFDEAFTKKYGKEITDKVKDIIDKFALSSDISEQRRLAKELHDLLPKIGITYIGIPMRDDLARLLTSKSGATKTELKKVAEAIKRIDAGIGEGDEVENDKIDGKEKIGDEKSEKHPEKDGKGVFAGKKGSDREQEGHIELPDDLDFDDELSEILEKTKSKLESEIKEEITKISKTPLPYIPPAKQTTATPFGVPPQTKMIEKKLETYIREIYDELAPKTIRRQRKGRICTKSLLKEEGSRYPTMKIFKKFERNRQNLARMAIVILVDNSSSMAFNGSNLARAKNACWAISEAMEAIGNPVAIITFRTADSTRLVKDFYHKGRWDYGADGGTDPNVGLLWAEKMLLHLRDTEQIENLIMCTISDGEWCDVNKSKELLKRVNKEGHIETIEINVIQSAFHGSKHQILIRDFSELPIKLREVMQNIQKRIAGRIST